MKIKEGNEVRSDLDGKDYAVTRIVDHMVILKSNDCEKQIVTEIETLKIFYKSKEEAKSRTPYRQLL